MSSSSSIYVGSSPSPSQANVSKRPLPFPPPPPPQEQDSLDGIFSQAIKQEDAIRPKNTFIKKLLLSSVGISILTVLVSMLILWLINPPMVHKKSENEIEKSSPSFVYILIWSIIAGVIVFGGPWVYLWISKAIHKYSANNNTDPANCLEGFEGLNE